MSKEKLCIYKPSSEKDKTTNTELSNILQKDILEDIIKKIRFEQKESTEFEQITKQGESNDVLYIAEKGSKLKLTKNGKESIIELPNDSIIGESTFLQYYRGKEITNANASVEIQGKYLQISFKNFQRELKTKSEKKERLVISYFEDLENNRKGKTKQVHNKN